LFLCSSTTGPTPQGPPAELLALHAPEGLGLDEPAAGQGAPA
jgi:hypothetical protein